MDAGCRRVVVRYGLVVLYLDPVCLLNGLKGVYQQVTPFRFLDTPSPRLATVAHRGECYSVVGLVLGSN
jgi:hypothetical protein